MAVLSPRTQKIQAGGTVTATLKWNPKFIARANRALELGGMLQKWIDGEILESIEPYVPTNNLVGSGNRNTVKGSGMLTWISPEARMFYYGILMVDPVTKVAGFLVPFDKVTRKGKKVQAGWYSRKGIKKMKDPKSRQFRFSKGGKAGPFWPERWKNDNIASFEKNFRAKAGELLRR